MEAFWGADSLQIPELPALDLESSFCTGQRDDWNHDFAVVVGNPTCVLGILLTRIRQCGLLKSSHNIYRLSFGPEHRHVMLIMNRVNQDCYVQMNDVSL